MSRRIRMIRRERGFGLIELMISLVMASFLVLGLMAMVGNVQRTYSNQTEFAAVNDKERFASALFGNLVATAGYFTLNQVTQTYLNTNPIPTRANALPANSPYIAGQAMTGQTAAASDTFNVRFQSNASDIAAPFNCLGLQTGTVAAIYESQLTVEGGNLVCRTGTNGAAVSNPTVLIDGVSNMTVRYGMDTLNGGSVTQYVPASAITTPANWFLVLSVQVTLTFTTKTMTTPPVYTQTFQVKYGESSR